MTVLIWVWTRKKVYVRDNEMQYSYHGSSVARGEAGGVGPQASPIGQSTKTQNKKNTTFLGLLGLCFALEWTKKWFRASFETYLQERVICQKLNSKISKNFEKCPKLNNQIWSLV